MQPLSCFIQFQVNQRNCEGTIYTASTFLRQHKPPARSSWESRKTRITSPRRKPISG